jgi:hypothetical protein
MTFSANGDFRSTAVVQNRTFEQAGKISVTGGQWSMRTSNDESYQGTYKLIRPDELEWTDQEDATVFLKRVKKP